jgi:hypothetical protein
MRKSMLIGGVSALMLVAVPAAAVGLGDLAKVVLGGKSVLKKADATCGTPANKLTAQDNSVLDVAVAAARKALPQAKFLALDAASDTAATTAAASPTFCPETAVKKKGMLGKIGSAGKKLLGAKILGL